MRKKDRLKDAFASVRADRPPMIDVTDRVLETIASLPQKTTKRETSPDVVSGFLEDIYPVFRYCALAAACLALAVVIPAFKSWETISSPMADFMSIAETLTPAGQSWLDRN